MSGWLRIEKEMIEHPKLVRIAALAECTVGDALEWWLRLWFFTAQHSPVEGDISRYSDVVAQLVATPNVNLHVQDMVKLELVDMPEVGSYQVHDWYEYQGRHLERLLRERNRSKVNRTRTRTDPVPVQEPYSENTRLRNDNDTVRNSSTPTPSGVGVARKPPTVEDVATYAAKYMADKGWTGPCPAERFHNHFTSNGWRVSGKAPMKDWKAAVRNWTRNDLDHGKLREVGTGPATGSKVVPLAKLAKADADVAMGRFRGLREDAEEKLGGDDFDTWVEPLHVVGVAPGDVLVLGHASDILVSWVTDHLLADLTALNGPLQLVLTKDQA